MSDTESKVKEEQPLIEEPEYVSISKKKRVKRDLSDESRARLADNARNSAWGKHVAEFRKAHPEIKGKQVFTEAKKTYKKVEKK